jgi:hypothetical protein
MAGPPEGMGTSSIVWRNEDGTQYVVNLEATELVDSN